MLRKCLLVLTLFFSFISTGITQHNTYEMEISLGGSFPLLPTLENGQEIYQLGPVINGTGLFPISSSLKLYGAGRIGFLTSTTYAEVPFSLISLSPGIEFRHQIHRLLLSFDTFLGAYIGLFEGKAGSDLFIQAGPSLKFLFTPEFSVGLSAEYTHCCVDFFSKSLYSGIQTSLTSSIALGSGRDTPLIEYDDVNLDPVFPVFHAYYDKHALGSLIIRNTAATDMKDLTITFFTPEYMDRPKECAQFETFPSGATAHVPLFGLFNKRILTTTEGTKVPGDISIRYSYLGATRSTKIHESITVKNRNAMTWDDDRKAASFITAKDEDILRFAKSTASFIRNNQSRIVNRTFRTAMGMLRALDQYGLRYVIDPSTPHSSFSGKEATVDYIQFPAQTLSFGGGDCDDLSILYAALLESVGIETAFITVPGHILLAFNTGVSPRNVSNVFVNVEDIIIREDSTWVPVEVTLLNDSFLAAWREGAKKWRQHAPNSDAKLLSVRSAWELYEPVDKPPLNTQLDTFDPREMSSAYQEDLEEMTSFQIHDRVHDLKNKIEKSDEKTKKVFTNKLGVLYARYGLYSDAKREFSKIVHLDYFPVILNLGNLYYIEGEYNKALQFYQRALSIRDSHPLANIGFARVQYELENYEKAQAAYLRAKEHDPGAASEFSYLASSAAGTETRAAESEAREEVMLWEY
jgi:tetratricopeptide (TPR) repeat protein